MKIQAFWHVNAVYTGKLLFLGVAYCLNLRGLAVPWKRRQYPLPKHELHIASNPSRRELLFINLNSAMPTQDSSSFLSEQWVLVTVLSQLTWQDQVNMKPAW